RPVRRAQRTPAIMLLPGYQMDPPIPKEWARKGCIALSVAPRGKLRSNRQFNPGYPNLLTHNIVDRHTYAYRGFYVDTWRGIDFPDRITCPIIVNIGLQDNVCPPETGYTLFEMIGARDKQLYPYDGHGHDAGRVRHSAIVDRFFARHLLDRDGNA